MPDRSDQVPADAAQVGGRDWFDTYVRAFNARDYAGFAAYYAPDVEFFGQAARLTGRHERPPAEGYPDHAHSGAPVSAHVEHLNAVQGPTLANWVANDVVAPTARAAAAR